jgi:hypothetical protein
MSNANHGTTRPTFTDEELKLIRKTIHEVAFLDQVEYRNQLEIVRRIDQYFKVRG